MNEDKPLTQQSDEDLMLAYKIGSKEAFNELYSRHAGRVYGYLKNKIMNSARADDIFQDTFLRMHRFRGRYNSSFPFLPWLFTICRNSMIDHLRKEKTQSLAGKASEENTSQLSFDHKPDSARQPLEVYMQGLSEREKKVIHLHFTEGLTFKSVAEKLSLSVENARKLSSRAVGKIRRSVKSDG